MHVCFFIGNGVDVANGLNTRYSDFYEHLGKKYNDNKSNNNKITAILGKEEKKYDWSDLGLAVGSISKEYEDEKKFIEENDEL